MKRSAIRVVVIAGTPTEIAVYNTSDMKRFIAKTSTKRTEYGFAFRAGSWCIYEIKGPIRMPGQWQIMGRPGIHPSDSDIQFYVFNALDQAHLIGQATWILKTIQIRERRARHSLV